MHTTSNPDPPESLIEMFMNTSFNNEFMSREEAIKAIGNMGKALYEETYGDKSLLYFILSNKPSDSIRELIRSNTKKGSLCFFYSRPEFAISAVKEQNDRDNNFYFLHVCRLKFSLNLFNPLNKSDIKKVSFSQRELYKINDEYKMIINNYNTDYQKIYLKIFEDGSIPYLIKKAGFEGITLNFYYSNDNTLQQYQKEGIYLFNDNKMKVIGIKEIKLKDNYQEYDEYLNNLKTKEELE